MPVPTYAQGVKSASYWMSHLDSVKSTTVAAKTDAAKSSASTTATASADSGKSFWDNVLDIVNPLQHLPVVGTIYRAATGDKMGDFEKVAGDTLYGGPIGFVTSMADIGFEKITGKSFENTLESWVGLDDSDSKNNTALAANTPKTAAPTANSAGAMKPLATSAGKTTTTTAATTAPRSMANTAPAPFSRTQTGARIVPAATSMPMVATFAPKHTTPPKPVQTVPAATQTTAPATIASTVTPSAISAANPVDISSNTDLLLQALARNGVTGDMQTQALDAYRRTMSMNTTPVSASVN